MKTSKRFKINFQLFAESQMSEEDIELLRYAGLDEDGNPLTNDNAEENQNGPLDINEEPNVTPEEMPDNLQDSQNGAVAPEELPKDAETDSLNNTGNEPALAEQTPLILGKFKNQAELERAYLELQNRLGRQSNEIGEMRRRLHQPPEEKITSDNGGLFDGVSDEELLKSFSSNPKKFLQGVLDIAGTETLEKAKAELKAETERENYLKEFFADNGDFYDLKEDFIAISDKVKDPEIALHAVRGMKLGKLDNLFSDTSYLKKHIDSPGMKEILSDVSTVDKLSEKVKQKIIDDYLKKARASNSQVTLISNEAGSAPKTPPKKYNNIGEIKEDAVAFLKALEKNKH